MKNHHVDILISPYHYLHLIILQYDLDSGLDK